MANPRALVNPKDYTPKQDWAREKARRDYSRLFDDLPGWAKWVMANTLLGFLTSKGGDHQDFLKTGMSPEASRNLLASLRHNYWNYYRDFLKSMSPPNDLSPGDYYQDFLKTGMSPSGSYAPANTIGPFKPETLPYFVLGIPRIPRSSRLGVAVESPYSPNLPQAQSARSSPGPEAQSIWSPPGPRRRIMTQTLTGKDIWDQLMMQPGGFAEWRKLLAKYSFGPGMKSQFQRPLGENQNPPEWRWFEEVLRQKQLFNDALKALEKLKAPRRRFPYPKRLMGW